MSYADGFYIRAQTVTFDDVADAIDGLLTGGLIPPTDNAYDLASGTYNFRNVYSKALESTTNLELRCNNNASYGILNFAWDGTNSWNFTPETTNSISLGLATKTFKKIFCTGFSDNGTNFVSSTIYNTTSSSGANVYIDGSGVMKRSTSSRRYKKDIAYDVDGSKLYDLKPASFTGSDDKARIGFIAEDVDLVDQRLVDYNNENQPDGVHYGLITALLTKAVQDLKVRVDALES